MTSKGSGSLSRDVRMSASCGNRGNADRTRGSAVGGLRVFVCAGRCCLLSPLPSIGRIPSSSSDRSCVLFAAMDAGLLAVVLRGGRGARVHPQGREARPRMTRLSSSSNVGKKGCGRLLHR